MLLNRIITAAVLIPLVLLAVFKLPNQQFTILWGVVILVGGWEWSSLAGYKGVAKRFFFSIAIAFFLLLIDYFSQQIIVTDGLLWLAFIWWSLISFLLFVFPGQLIKKDYSAVQLTLVGFVVLVPAWQALGLLHAGANGAVQVLYFLVLIWTADSAAYFAGRAFGKHKLAPLLSPGKTLEGVAGALVATTLYAGAFSFFNEDIVSMPLAFILLSIVTVLYSICGDLFESLAKRKRGVKDSGAILPGHGGILDRVDSLLCAAPIYLFGVQLIGDGVQL